MLFNSYIFVLLFLPLCVIGYFLLNKLHSDIPALIFLIAMSLWFYGYFNPYYLIIICSSIIVNYCIYRIMRRTHKFKKVFLVIGIILNVALLVYFKYMDFFISNINTLFNKELNLLHIALPLGISFFTFQQISFIIDSYKDEIPEYSFINYAAFVSFFPQLVAGPIVTHDELIPQLIDNNNKKVNYDNLLNGLYVFSIGLAKKVLLADTFGNGVNWGFSNIDSLDTTNAILCMLGYTFQIYFDFSGYCDMAIGISKMLNINLPINFNSPYKSYNILEFWKRWHITLTKFLTKYIYIPLGGNRKGNIRTYINVMIVFLVSGFWHGANWTFVLWGLCHGVFSVVTRIYKQYFDKLHPAFNWIITFSFVNFTWIIFRADSIYSAFQFINRILLLNFGPINYDLKKAITLPELDAVLSHIPYPASYEYIILALLYIVSFIIIFSCRNSSEIIKEAKPSLPKAIISVFLILWCTVSFCGVSTFLYFNF